MLCDQEFTITERPMVKKNSRKFITKGRQRFTVPGDNFVRYQNHALKEIFDQVGYLKTPMFYGPIEVQTIFYIPGRIRVDGDNLHTSILDILQKAKVIDDDNNVLDGHYQKKYHSPDWLTKIYIKVLEDHDF